MPRYVGLQTDLRSNPLQIGASLLEHALAVHEVLLMRVLQNGSSLRPRTYAGLNHPMEHFRYRLLDQRTRNLPSVSVEAETPLKERRLGQTDVRLRLRPLFRHGVDLADLFHLLGQEGVVDPILLRG